MQDSATPNLGAWTPEELNPTLRDSSGAGADTDAPAETRFVRGVVRVVRSMHSQGRTYDPTTTLAVFLLQPHCPTSTSLHFEPMFDTGRAQISGMIWFVSAPVVSAKGLPLKTNEAGAAFIEVTNDLQLGHVPAVVLNSQHGTLVLRYYPQGLGIPDVCEGLEFGTTKIEIAEIEHVIQRLYEQSLRTPESQPPGIKLWKDAARFVPVEDAEARIQALLKAAFLGAFKTCKVYHEVTGNNGRADLHIEEQDTLDPSRTRHLAVLELKVLKSYFSKGTSAPSQESWVQKGVLQAGAYKNERGYIVAACCCFDMRKEDDKGKCVESVATIAKEQTVTVHRWFLYASSESWRAAEAKRFAGSAR